MQHLPASLAILTLEAGCHVGSLTMLRSPCCEKDYSRYMERACDSRETDQHQVSQPRSQPPGQLPSVCDPIRKFKQKRSADLRGLEPWSIIPNCCFKPLNFGTFCYTAVDKWNTWENNTSRHLESHLKHPTAIKNRKGKYEWTHFRDNKI